MKRLLLVLSVFLLTVSAAVFPGMLRAASGVTADAPSLNFGNQAEGTISAPQTITLTHSMAGDGSIGTVIVAGLNPRQFLISQDLCSGVVLANGQSCTLMVVYRPSAAFSDGVGPAQAELLIPFIDPPDLSIGLSGDSLVPQIQSDVSSISFGEQVEGQLSDPQTIVLTNAGQADLILKNSKFIGGDTNDFSLSLDFCSFQTLTPGETCQMEVKMRPTDVGERTAQLAIETNDPAALLFLIDLSGTGTGSGGCALDSKNDRTDLGTWAMFFAVPLLLLFSRGIARPRISRTTLRQLRSCRSQ